MRHHEVSTWITMMLTSGQDVPQCNTGCQDLVQSVDRQQNFGEMIAALLPRLTVYGLWSLLFLIDLKIVCTQIYSIYPSEISDSIDD